MNPDLLQPSLGRDVAARPLYSTTALFLPAFFGGPASAAIIFALNAHRANRFAPDLPLVVLGVAVAIAAPWLIIGAWSEAPEWSRYLLRALGIAAAGLYYLRHRALYRTQELFGLSPPSGWVAGLSALAAGIGISWLTALLLSAG